ncbi:MAG: hypothetical protein EAZ08_12605 [Cytophagales bacterium]|nr:MAG: hypothetical protein EAZ08_12605 [Cytophagales bacterium]
MSSKGEYISEQHQENKQWAANLAFYKDELQVLRNRLGEISAKNSATEIKMQVSHFENQCIINAEQIDELSHAVKESEAKILKSVEMNPVATDHRKIEDHSELREKVATFEEMFKTLRTEANEFFAKVM